MSTIILMSRKCAREIGELVAKWRDVTRRVAVTA
jgi:hypothetical protein